MNLRIQCSSKLTNAMTNATESLIDQEDRSPNSSWPPFLNAKNSVRIGTCNIRTMWKTTRSAHVVRLMRDFRLDILGISECRWTGSGNIKIGDRVEILYSEMPEGVRMFMELSFSWSSWTHVNTKHRKIPSRVQASK